MKIHKTASCPIGGLTAEQVNALLPKLGGNASKHVTFHRVTERGGDGPDLLAIQGGCNAALMLTGPDGREYVGASLTPLERRHNGEIPRFVVAGIRDVLEKDTWDVSATIVGQEIILAPVA